MSQPVGHRLVDRPARQQPHQHPILDNRVAFVPAAAHLLRDLPHRHAGRHRAHHARRHQIGDRHRRLDQLLKQSLQPAPDGLQIAFLDQGGCCPAVPAAAKLLGDPPHIDLLYRAARHKLYPRPHLHQHEQGRRLQQLAQLVSDGRDLVDVGLHFHGGDRYRMAANILDDGILEQEVIELALLLIERVLQEAAHDIQVGPGRHQPGRRRYIAGGGGAVQQRSCVFIDPQGQQGRLDRCQRDACFPDLLDKQRCCRPDRLPGISLVRRQRPGEGMVVDDVGGGIGVHPAHCQDALRVDHGDGVNRPARQIPRQNVRQRAAVQMQEVPHIVVHAVWQHGNRGRLQLMGGKLGGNCIKIRVLVRQDQLHPTAPVPASTARPSAP